ncbi:hypothetical protein BB560_000482 [Smittium megazygosporum]|uniref:Mre11 DNA-binding domain-containing protein n=1 Tax=Smittium megazygosporum TaxID=133381 RepID=A0A2T9ZKE8_9FUNG|nr:hypothetical protein BB560_000482 [Smittium megazygosporum]
MGDDEIRILIATDNHLGYLEKDPVRSLDSFYAFEEIFQLAKIKNADFVFLCGDIFHINQPSRTCMHRALGIFKKYCLGDKKPSVEFLTDPKSVFSSNSDFVNYLDPKLNISLPVFAIHGNHDDPSGESQLSAIDILSEAGLVNYFGKAKSVDKITLDPLLFKKGSTCVAIYGLGGLRDERLVPHGRKNYIPEEFLEDFLDVVIWGHEHECLIDPQPNPTKQFYVIQPGSSVATSLSDSETKPKYVCLMKITGKQFKLEKLRLQNVRPFSMTTVVLDEVSGIKKFTSEEKIIKHLSLVLENQIKYSESYYMEQLKEKVDGVSNFLGPNPKPLVRIRVDYSGGFEPFFSNKFGINFINVVANPREILLFYKRKKAKFLMGDSQASYSSLVKGEGYEEDDQENVDPSSNKIQMSRIVESFVKPQDLKVFVDLELHDAVRQFVEKGDNNSINM